MEAGECFAHWRAHAGAHGCGPLNLWWQCSLQSEPNPHCSLTWEPWQFWLRPGGGGSNCQVGPSPSPVLSPRTSEPHGNCHYLETVCWGGDSTVSKTTGRAWRGHWGLFPGWRSVSHWDLRDLGGPETGPFCSIAESRGQNTSLVSFQGMGRPCWPLPRIFPCEPWMWTTVTRPPPKPAAPWHSSPPGNTFNVL